MKKTFLFLFCVSITSYNIITSSDLRPTAPIFKPGSFEQPFTPGGFNPTAPSRFNPTANVFTPVNPNRTTSVQKAVAKVVQDRPQNTNASVIPPLPQAPIVHTPARSSSNNLKYPGAGKNLNNSSLNEGQNNKAKDKKRENRAPKKNPVTVNHADSSQELPIKKREKFTPPTLSAQEIEDALKNMDTRPDVKKQGWFKYIICDMETSHPSFTKQTPLFNTCRQKEYGNRLLKAAGNTPNQILAIYSEAGEKNDTSMDGIAVTEICTSLNNINALNIISKALNNEPYEELENFRDQLQTFRYTLPIFRNKLSIFRQLEWLAVEELLKTDRATRIKSEKLRQELRQGTTIYNPEENQQAPCHDKIIGPKKPNYAITLSQNQKKNLESWNNSLDAYNTKVKAEKLRRSLNKTEYKI